MSVTFNWAAKLVFFDRISKTWRKPTFLTVRVARMTTAARKATEKYRQEYMNLADRRRAGRIKLDLERIYPG